MLIFTLPDGYAGGRLLWLPQLAPADGSSPVKKRNCEKSTHCTHDSNYRIFSSLKLLTESDVRMLLQVAPPPYSRYECDAPPEKPV